MKNEKTQDSSFTQQMCCLKSTAGTASLQPASSLTAGGHTSAICDGGRNGLAMH
eukprot:CAMPEP_0194770320 /NCGR_PEP_ID=MMETSP0323_2-20130528/45905_1 /TAXON_ID=2866 ORGANISM="Crypthecodinium cohnii, Strain Seligo" /NCGR_SAMPLE_ID=MMETSP0323_2 /ASSEMBLY_ACC=CAM_ASM_000346 /LENGTH=53 /DNA_ID=CAMNT_0039703835 /DNA_START=64 /DNA_END=222 /DNA_ORIENTATION=+